MPAHQGNCSRQPARGRVGEKVSEPFYRVPTEKWADGVSDDPLRQPSQKWNGRRAKQKQRRSYGHKQKVLHHVGRERDIVKSGKRRAEGDPKRKQTREECGEPPGWDQCREKPSNAQPASGVYEGREDERNVNPRWARPRLQNSMSLGRHGWAKVASKRACQTPAPGIQRAKSLGRLVDLRDAMSEERKRGRSFPQGLSFFRKRAYCRRPGLPAE